MGNQMLKPLKQEHVNSNDINSKIGLLYSSHQLTGMTPALERHVIFLNKGSLG